MKNIKMTLAALALVVAMPQLASAQHKPKSEKQNSPALKVLMAELFNDLKGVNKGLFYTDFASVAKHAQKIADHPPIRTSQRKTLMKTFGKEMVRFKSYDTKVHDAAVELAKAAKASNIERMTKQYNVMVKNCMACHKEFRDRAIKALRPNSAHLPSPFQLHVSQK